MAKPGRPNQSLKKVGIGERWSFFWGFHIDFYLFQIVYFQLVAIADGGEERVVWWRCTAPTSHTCATLILLLLRCSLQIVPATDQLGFASCALLRCHFYYVSTRATLIPPNCPSCSAATDHFGKPIDVNCNTIQWGNWDQKREPRHKSKSSRINVLVKCREEIIFAKSLDENRTCFDWSRLRNL